MHALHRVCMLDFSFFLWTVFWLFVNFTYFFTFYIPSVFGHLFSALIILLWHERRHPVCRILFQHSRSWSGFSGKVSNKQISNIVMLTVLLSFISNLCQLSLETLSCLKTVLRQFFVSLSWSWGWCLSHGLHSRPRHQLFCLGHHSKTA